jgi:flagellin-specific chaperone FliS
MSRLQTAKLLREYQDELRRTRRKLREANMHLQSAAEQLAKAQTTIRELIEPTLTPEEGEKLYRKIAESL